MPNKSPGIYGRIVAHVFLEGWRPTLWLVGLVFILYARCLQYGPILLDDNIFLQSKFAFLADWRNFPELFRRDAFLGFTGHFYRPLLISTFMLDAHLWGQSPGLW